MSMAGSRYTENRGKEKESNAKTKLGIEDEMTFFPPVNECPVLYKDGV